MDVNHDFSSIKSSYAAYDMNLNFISMSAELYIITCKELCPQNQLLIEWSVFLDRPLQRVSLLRFEPYRIRRIRYTKTQTVRFIPNTALLHD